MIQRALVSSDPLVLSRVVIFCTVQLPKGDIGVKRLVARSLHQAAVLHKFLHEHVNFTLDFYGLQYGIFSGGPPLDFSVYEVRIVLALLARRLVEFLLGIGIRLGFHSFGIRLAMAGPVTAIGFRRRSEGGRRRGSIALVIRSTRHCKSIDTGRPGGWD